MVIISRTAVFPTPDKAAEVQSVVEDFVRSNPNNIRISLWRAILGELPTLSVVSLFDGLEEFEKNRDANFENPDYVQSVAKINSMVRQPNTTRLATSLVDPVGEITADHRYTQQAVIRPTTQGQAAVRDIVVDFAKGMQAERPLFRATQAIFPHDGPGISMLDSYETLAELENFMRQRAGKIDELRSKIGPNLSAPTMSRVREVIVPMSG
ncbi:MAG: hypothetical protein IIC83_09155 [Chloroflexi bacterium]|nr:hypothetical protein [Chloroflexota bacterium]